MILSRYAAALVALLALTTAAHAQRTPLYQSGTLSPYDLLKGASNGIAEKAPGLNGDTLGRGVNPFSITDFGGLGVCSHNAVTTGVHKTICLGHNAAGSAVMTIDGAEYTLPQSVGVPPQAMIGTNTELKATSTATFPSVFRMGFFARGDTPPLGYAASSGACVINGGLGDDAVEVPSSNGKCWIAQPDSGGIDFRQWGVQTASFVDDQLDHAIAYACRTKTIIKIPFLGYDENIAWRLQRAHAIGNGSEGAGSTCNGVTFITDVQYQEYAQSQGSMFQWYGPAGIVPITFQGPMLSATMRGVTVDCRNICSTGIRISNVMDGDFGWLGVRRNIGPGFVITTEPNNNWVGGMEGSHFYNLLAGFPGPGGSGMDVGNTTCSTCVAAVIQDVFENLTLYYDSTTAGTYALRLGFATQLTFIGGRFNRLDFGTPGVLGNALVIAPPPGALGFPSDITFYHPVFEGTVLEGAGWAPLLAGVHFDSWSTGFSPFPVSTGYRWFWGTDNHGKHYPDKAAWTPADGSGAALVLTSGDARWFKIGQMCSASFNIKYPVTASGATARVNGIPAGCAPAVLSGGTSVAGGNASWTDMTTPVNINVDDSGSIIFVNPSAASTPYTNANLSDKRITANFTWITE